MIQIPACSHEKQVYESPLGPWDGVSKNYLRRVNGPYQSCIPGHIADVDLEIPGDLAERMSVARAAAERVDQALRYASYDLPSILLRSESTSSSRVENLTVSAKKIALAQVGRSSSTNAKLNLANIEAMEEALSSNGVTRTTIETVQKVLIEDPRFVGIRDGAVWVSSNPYGPREAAFVPPAPERLDDALEDLTRFAGRDDLDPLLKAFVFHAQFETVHPFADGNGRVGRAMVHLILKDAGVCENACLPISAGLLADLESYHRALDAYRMGDAEPIVSLMTDSLSSAALAASKLKADMDAFIEDWESMVGGRAGSAVRALGPLFVSRPALTREEVCNSLHVSGDTASKALAQALKSGVISREGSARSTVYIADAVVDATEADCRAMPLWSPS